MDRESEEELAMDLSDIANSLDQVEVSMKDNEERLKELYGTFTEVSAAMAKLAVKARREN